MKYFILTLVLLSSFLVSAQGDFKEETTVNGILYKASKNTTLHATYIQQDNFDFALAADSFYVDEMTPKQWDNYADAIISNEDAKWDNDMYHTNNGCQVFTHSTEGDNLLVVRLFGSKD